MTTLTIIAIAVVAWLAVLLFAVTLLRIAARADEVMEEHQRDPWAREMEAAPAGPASHRRRGLRERAKPRGRQHEAMLGGMLEVLALRDPPAVRHAAAVAHYARALAGAAGLPARELEVVHTAGLLHDIGRFALPDNLLTPDADVDAAGRGLIHRHPIDGARLLRGIPELTDVADVIEAHHERMDGTGYPHGLAGERIPRGARVLAIAEVYDTLTAPDSYRDEMDGAWVVGELRRVADRQLDGRLVEVFVEAVVGDVGDRTRRFQPSLEDELRAARSASHLFDSRSS